ncbi:hypothetical protein [Oryzobacter telluris]|uniref:hypothetical protein n=1 Tax=Oryzobacter telluris TaxID=3149179 RepID=UPI00370D8B2E
MNRTTVSPVQARTDVASPAPAVEPAAATVGASAQASAGTAVGADADLVRAVRRRGLGLAAGAAIWAGSIFTVGSNPDTVVGITISDLGALPFQAGVMGLLGAMSLTGAVGRGRGARVVIGIERVLLSLAMLWTVLHGAFPAFRDATWLAVLDAFWPLSMLGMFVIGIKVAVGGRWRGLARVWPLVAESWAVVTVPSFLLLGAPYSDWIGGGHLLLGYTVLGLILARRTALVLPRT